jgi:ATPase subunit of ABC transporter with duplicated ATPase domains
MSYVSESKYSLPSNFTYREKVDFVTRMCKSGLWLKSECVKYIEELENEQRFLKASIKNAQSFTTIKSVTPGNYDKVLREEERRLAAEEQKQAAEDKYWEDELEKEFAKLEKEKEDKKSKKGGRIRRTRKGSKKSKKSKKRIRKSKRRH